MYLRNPKFLNDQNFRLVDKLAMDGQFINGQLTQRRRTYRLLWI